MIVTGVLLGLPQTRGKLPTLGLVLLWTRLGAYSQRKAGTTYWVPLCNAVLGSLVHWLEKDCI